MRAESREGGKVKMEPREGKVTAKFVSLFSFYFCQKKSFKKFSYAFLFLLEKIIFLVFASGVFLVLGVT
jgi:hypothetical protein